MEKSLGEVLGLVKEIKKELGENTLYSKMASEYKDDEEQIAKANQKLKVPWRCLSDCVQAMQHISTLNR